MGSAPIRVAVVGDIHLTWDARDVAALDGAGYDLILFVGDFAQHLPGRAAQVGRAIAPLATPALAIAGNHDATVPWQHEARALRLPRLARRLGALMVRQVEALEASLAPVPLGAYGLHRFAFGAGVLQVLVARPFSEGGPRLAFPDYLEAAHGVRSMEESAARLCALLDAADAAVPLVVLAHNGPSGLGRGRGTLWGARPRRHEGDGGDPDLEALLAHARRTGKRVRAVVGGHLHHQPRRGEPRRPTWLARDGVLYVNAAEVPRHRARGGAVEAYHVLLELGADGDRVDERWIPLASR